ncbi:MAG: lysylphosphatidylglycerol synthase domain-containing protein [Candidatus Cloacimonadota bacterium]|nr:lysylphosphatidylglycerol synthase domain-containing protein [Candidatus Cloacimonadota bacterium]
MKLKKSIFYKIIISSLFLIFLFYFVKPNQILQALGQANLFWVLLALLLLPINLSLQFLRWKSLVVIGNKNVPNSEILKSIFYSFSYSIFTPARLGEIGRAFHISDSKRGDLIALALYEKIFAFCSLLLFVLLSLVFFKSHFYLLGLFILALIIVELKKIVKLIPYFRKYEQIIQRVNTLKISLISVTLVFVYIFQFYLILNAFKNVPFFHSIFMISLVIFFNSLPITLSGLGIRELLSVCFFKVLEVSPASAASAAFLIFCINILIPTFLGFVLHLIPKKIK